PQLGTVERSRLDLWPDSISSEFFWRRPMSESSFVMQADWLAEYPPLRSLSLDQEALRIFEHAYFLGLKTEKPGVPRISFSTLMAALLLGKDESSRWFVQQAAENGPNASVVFAEKHIDETLRAISPPSGKPQPVHLSTDKNLLTLS